MHETRVIKSWLRNEGENNGFYSERVWYVFVRVDIGEDGKKPQLLNLRSLKIRFWGENMSNFVNAEIKIAAR